MEQPLRRNELDLNQPFEGDAGSIGKHKEVPQLAGHILLHDTPHAGEITLAEQAPQIGRTEHSAWHSIKLDAEGQVMEQNYGQAFTQEQHPEQMAAAQDQTQTQTQTQTQAPATPGVVPMPTNPVAAPIQFANNPLLQPAALMPASSTIPEPSSLSVPTPSYRPTATPYVPSVPVAMPVNPIYATMGQTQHSPSQAVPPTPSSVPSVPVDPYPSYVQPSQQMPAMADPVAVPQASAEHQQMSATPMGVPQPQPMPGTYQPQPPTNMPGAINPSYAQPALPQMQEPRLPVGTPTHVDLQHRLPATKHRIKAALRSPWLWLAIGILMIFYFAPSIFSA